MVLLKVFLNAMQTGSIASAAFVQRLTPLQVWRITTTYEPNLALPVLLTPTKEIDGVSINFEKKSFTKEKRKNIN